VKIQLIADLLRRSAHEVEVISQGALEPLVGTDKLRFRFYPRFSESERFHPDIPIDYVSALSMKFLIGLWESVQTTRLLAARHRRSPYDAVIIYNMQAAQVGCARYAQRLGLPVILEYEDDSFVDVHGRSSNALIANYHLRARRQLLRSIAGGTAVSPYLLDQMPPDIPKILLRGMVSHEILKSSQGARASKKNWVVFSGTHEGTQGLEQMIKAWHMLDLPGWELHIAGQGPITATLEKMAQAKPSIVFHGLLNREENARMICAAKIGMNPQDLTRTPGNVFPFKIVEYLAAATHVITTPRGALERELEAGVTYIADNAPETIAASLKQVIEERGYERTAEQAAVRTYGPDAISRSLNELLEQVTGKRQSEPQARFATAAGVRATSSTRAAL
jgi:glycosyltransferase involved in cell wall biosynthesis